MTDPESLIEVHRQVDRKQTAIPPEVAETIEWVLNSQHNYIVHMATIYQHYEDNKDAYLTKINAALAWLEEATK